MTMMRKGSRRHEEQEQEVSTIRIAMRQAQRRRLFSPQRPLILCIFSSCIMIVILYLHTIRSFSSANAAAAWNTHYHQSADDESSSWRRGKGFLLSSARYRNSHASSSNPVPEQESQRQDASAAATTTSSSPSSLATQQFAIPPLHQFTPRRADDAGNDAADAQQQDEEEEQRYHNPSLYGWTPDVYPDPLQNPIRCAIAYLPETNMTDGLRCVVCVLVSVFAFV